MMATARKVSRRVPVFSASQFTWERKVGSAEISDLGEEFSPYGVRLWDDACDTGFAVRSPRTGRVLTFAYCGDREDGRGEIIGWTYSCLEDPDFSITLIND